MEVKVPYLALSSFEFAQVMQKITSVPTSNANANHIRKIMNEIEAARKIISEAYKTEIMEKYAKKNEAGELIRPEGDPAGFVTEDGKAEEYAQAETEFAKRMAIIKWRPMTPKTLADIKISAKELNLLGALFTEEEGPGLPEFPFPNGAAGNIHNLHQ